MVALLAILADLCGKPWANAMLDAGLSHARWADQAHFAIQLTFT
jgi:hypothetical protein